MLTRFCDLFLCVGDFVPSGDIERGGVVALATDGREGSSLTMS